jgi:4-hydroxybenzoate polyprenyltransferase
VADLRRSAKKMSFDIFIREYRALAFSMVLFAVSAFMAALFILSFSSEGGWPERVFVLVVAAATFHLGRRLYRMRHHPRIMSADGKEGPNQPPQRNAGSRPSSDGSSASETPSSHGPRA